MKKKMKLPRRPMTEDERELAVALRDYCFSSDGLPVWQWSFVKLMCNTPELTDKQGDYLRKMAGWYGVEGGEGNV